MILSYFYVDEIIRTALKEDVNYIDVSTAYVIPENQKSNAVLIAKADGVLCGIDIAIRVFELLDSNVKVDYLIKDTEKIKKGDKIAYLHGNTSMLLQGERTALNILQHLSGISTAVSKCVEAISGTNASIVDTRKTIPGIRALQKYAVTCGGGKNHRFNLSDAVMLKDNHIDAGGGITKTVELLRNKLGHTVKIEVETRNIDEVKEALAVNADIIMLDNMSIDEMSTAVSLIKKQCITEASGNITLENIKAVANTGIDIISMGSLTHSVEALDISMKIQQRFYKDVF